MRCRSYRVSLLALIMIPLIGPAPAVGRMGAGHHAAGLQAVSLGDYYALRSVGRPAVSPDGRSVAYVVTQAHRATDRKVSTLWRVATDGGAARPLTHGDDSVSSPGFSPDGRLISFVSSRDASAWGMPEEVASRGQVYVMPVSGGEAFPVTEVEGGVRSYRWSPDGKRLAIVSMPPRSGRQANAAGRAVPIVVTRLKHKSDGRGYLDDRRTQIYDVGVEGALDSLGMDRGAVRELTDGAYDSSNPSFAPDGRWVAFESNRTAEPDANLNTDIWKVEVASGRTVRVTDYAGSDGSPVFSPDGAWIAYISTDPEWSMYPTPRVMAVPSAGGAARNLTGDLDRWARGAPVWAPDSRSIYVSLADEGRTPLVQASLDAEVTRVVEGNVGAALVGDGQVVLRYTRNDRPAEIYVAPLDRLPVEESSMRGLSRANTDHVAGLDFNPSEGMWFESADGPPVHAWVIKPPGFDQTRKYPLILWIHGGPVGQFTNGFNMTHQYLASLGYVVLLVNPRGSTGYGEEFSRAIFADWGGPDYDDVMAGVDALIARGYVDADRMGVGGYSYGGILTNYVIVKTDRFKGAVSAASDSDYYGAFGTDDWGMLWIHEFGAPWDNIDLYRKVSPATYIKNAVTPTLFIHGGEDYRDPLSQSEHLYLALRVLDVETGLIVYPGQSHGFGVPSYEADRLRRYGLWFDKYVKGEPVDPLYSGFHSDQ